MIDLASVLRRRGDVRFRLLDGEAVVLRQRAGEVMVLNEVGARILELADGTTPVSGWVEALAAEYEVGRDELARDVLYFAGELTAAEVLEPVA
jgi:hypothetical protein